MCHCCGSLPTETRQRLEVRTVKIIKHRSFANGNVFALQTDDGFLIETTETFLPFYTKNAINENTNKLKNSDLGSREERWMIGVSCMSGCPVKCKFCATGQMKKWRPLTAAEIVEQVVMMIEKAGFSPDRSQEFKINYTRMGEPFLNIEAVKEAIESISSLYPNTHHYISTVGIKNSDFSWIKDNITLQVSLHSLDEERRNSLIPYRNKMAIRELGQVRTKSAQKTTLNCTLVDTADFDISVLRENFPPDNFFVKLSPVNPNKTSDLNGIGVGIIKATNVI